MRRFTLHELIEKDILCPRPLSGNDLEAWKERVKPEIVCDLLHIYRTREGSAEKHSDELIAELLAEAIVAIKIYGVHPDAFK